MSETEARKRGRPRAFHEDREGKIVQSLDKALVIFKIVSQSAGSSLSEIAEASSIPPATAYRALITLQKHGMVAFDDHAQLWSIDVEAYRIGSTFLANTSIVEQARPVMLDLMQQTGETSNLGILSNQEVVFLSQVETHQPIRAFFRPGTRGSIHASGIGKALFSFQPGEKAVRLAQSLSMTRFTDKTVATSEDLLETRVTALQRGFAIDDEERTEGMRCIAAPIFNTFGEAVAAISVSGPTVRISDPAIPEIGGMVRASADDITRNVGGQIQEF